MFCRPQPQAYTPPALAIFRWTARESRVRETTRAGETLLVPWSGGVPEVQLNVSSGLAVRRLERKPQVSKGEKKILENF